MALIESLPWYLDAILCWAAFGLLAFLHDLRELASYGISIVLAGLPFYLLGGPLSLFLGTFRDP